MTFLQRDVPVERCRQLENMTALLPRNYGVWVDR
jgi:hypothetical protein